MKKYGLYAIWVISCLASFGSFYLGEPSTLDWGQRICLFPFVFIAGIAAWRGFLGISSYLLPQTFLGLCLALFQYLLIKKPELGLSFLSEPEQDPWVSLSAAALFFCLFVLLLILSKRHSQRMFL